MQGTAHEVRMQIAYGAGKISVVKMMLEDNLQELYKKAFEIHMKPIHIDVTRRGKWIRTKTHRYKVPLWFDPMQKMNIEYTNPIWMLKA